MRKLLIAIAALLIPASAFAAPVYVPSQGGAVGPIVTCTNPNGDTIRCVQPSVTLNDATGVAIGTSGNPLFTSGATGAVGDVNVKQVNGATVNVGTGAAGTGTQRVTTSTDSGNLAIGANGAAAKTSSVLGAVSDGTNQQQLIAPIALADGVNGNNSLAVGGYVWNGVTWDRMPGSTTGVTTKSTLQAGTAIAGKFGIDQTTPGITNGVQTLTGSTTAVTGTVATNLSQVGGASTVTGGSTGLLGVGGAQASGAAIVGNPFVIAGAIGANAQTVGATGLSSDTYNAGNVGLVAASFGSRFNGTSWDRERGNLDTAALITLTAAGAGTTNSADQTNYNGRGVSVVIDVTAATAMTVTVNVQVKDAASGKYVTVLASAALAATGTTLLQVFPGATAAANTIANAQLSRTWRVQTVVTGTSVTATVGASVIL